MSAWIEKWNPEDEAFWESEGRYVARRNLIFSIFAEFIGFSVWQLFSIVGTLLPAMRFAFSPNQLFWLVALPGLIGATMRFPYTFAVGIFGGRNWTIVSALLLLAPIGMLGILVQDTDTPFWLFAVAAMLGGLGGGNFASSMANISYFYPNKKKGTALGFNAAGGNLGVGVAQFLVPVVIHSSVIGALLGGSSQLSIDSQTGVTSEVWVQNAAFFWVPLIVLSAICAYFFMDNLNVSQASFKEQAVVTRRKHTWIMSYLYLGTFGSFIGYSASFPLLMATQFPNNLVLWAALGPILGSLVRPFGGRLSERLGGAYVTFWSFILMIGAVLGILYFLGAGSFAGFLSMFLILFITTGIGNGSTYQMIPTIFRAERLRKFRYQDEDLQEAVRRSLKEAAFALGFVGAIAAYGGFVIPRAYGYSIETTGGPQTALLAFIAFYVTCVAITWWFYYRRNAEIRC